MVAGPGCSGKARPCPGHSHPRSAHIREKGPVHQALVTLGAEDPAIHKADVAPRGYGFAGAHGHET